MPPPPPNLQPSATQVIFSRIVPAFECIICISEVNECIHEKNLIIFILLHTVISLVLCDVINL